MSQGAGGGGVIYTHTLISGFGSGKTYMGKGKMGWGPTHKDRNQHPSSPDPHGGRPRRRRTDLLFTSGRGPNG